MNVIKIIISIFCLSMLIIFSPLHAQEENDKSIQRGKKLVLSRSKGNCVACHAFEGSDQAGNLGPTLIAMKLRFPDKNKLFQQIWDATKNNPTSSMPPFGKNRILTEEEINDVVAYISTL